MIYASISIGQLFNKYKILAAVITYVIFYIISQICNTISMLIMSLRTPTSTVLDSTSTTYGYASVSGLDGSLFSRSMVQSLIFIAIYYGISVYIGSKKVNLD